MQLEEEGYLETIHKKYFTFVRQRPIKSSWRLTGSAILMSMILAMTSISHLSRRVLKNEGPKKALEALKAIKVASPK